MLFKTELPGAARVGPVLYDEASGRAAIAVDFRWRIFDAARAAFVPLERELPPLMNDGTCSLEGGEVYYPSRERVVAIDLRRARARTVLQAPAWISGLTCTQDGTLYFTCGAELYRKRRR